MSEISERKGEGPDSGPPSSAEPSVDPTATEIPFPPARYAWMVVTILMILYVFSFIDRTLLTFLVDPITNDLQITDLQMSYLLGFSFALFYTFFGLPIGWLADRFNRKTLIGAGLFVWTMMTAGCGIAKRYAHFLLFRIGIGVGEATLSPSAYSIIADTFPRHKLGTALSVYSMGIFIGAGLSSMIGGNVAQWAMGRDDMELALIGVIRPWQLAFIVVGIVGLAPLLLLGLFREPKRRGTLRKGAGGRAAGVSISETLGYIGKNWKTVVCHHLGFAILGFSSYGVGSWAPTFMARTHGWEPGRTGMLFGLHVITAGCLGIYVGGRIADWLTRRGHTDSMMRVGLLASVLWIPTGMLYPLVGNGWVCWGLMIPTYFFTSFPTGAAAAAIQNIMPNQMRAQASSIYLFAANLIGMGLGPTGVALLTDHLFKDPSKLRYSLVIVGCLSHAIAIFLFWAGCKPYRESVKRLEAWEKANA